MPVEDHGAPTHGPVHPVEAADYDSLRKRADQLAQTNCTAAKDLYRRALEQKPNGVEALTGMAYCELDAKDFASAYREFSTALVVSTNYEPALAGIAETYQQQGNKAKAIDAWHKYLGVYPGSMKAKRQLELLGEGDAPTPSPPSGANGDSGGSASSGPGSAAPAPGPAPAPAPSSGDSAPAASPAAGSDQ
jgi:tetratricopeptide (TPR) repeat protein